MLSQSSISSKSRKQGSDWARSFLGAGRAERNGHAGREHSDADAVRARNSREGADIK